MAPVFNARKYSRFVSVEDGFSRETSSGTAQWTVYLFDHEERQVPIFSNLLIILYETQSMQFLNNKWIYFDRI